MGELESGGARRRVPIDWDELEMAMTWHSDEWRSYLDVRTGQVRQQQAFAYGGAREDFDLSDDELEEALADGLLIPIEPLPSSVEHGWMEDFAASVGDPHLRRRLDRALGGRGPFRRFKDALADVPAERDRWFRFRDARVREAAREWLAEHGLEPTTAPPERPAPGAGANG